MAATLAVLALTTGASATGTGDRAVDPGTRVNGMLVVQGLAQDAETALFANLWCDPIVLSRGRRIRTCARIRHVSRLFVGHGIFAPRRTIDRAWKRLTWDMWIDGEHVSLSRFGHTDRWLLNFPPAGGRDVVLREWAILLLRPEGRHSIRYRTRDPSGALDTDTTWKFFVERN